MVYTTEQGRATEVAKYDYRNCYSIVCYTFLDRHISVSNEAGGGVKVRLELARCLFLPTKDPE
jgi:hypothetical protein